MMNVVKFYGEELTPVLNRDVNGQNAIQLVDRDGAPFMMASIAHDINIADDEVIIKNYSENEGILEALIEAGIIDKPYCEVPVNFVTLYVARLRDIDPVLDQRI